MILISPEAHKINCAIRFGFKAPNNEADYEALVRELQVHNVKIFNDSQLVVNQINDIYLARGEKMAAYLEKEKEQLSSFFVASIELIP